MVTRKTLQQPGYSLRNIGIRITYYHSTLSPARLQGVGNTYSIAACCQCTKLFNAQTAATKKANPSPLPSSEKAVDRGVPYGTTVCIQDFRTFSLPLFFLGTEKQAVVFLLPKNTRVTIPRTHSFLQIIGGTGAGVTTVPSPRGINHRYTENHLGA